MFEGHVAADDVPDDRRTLVGDPEADGALVEIGVPLPHQPIDLLAMTRLALGLGVRSLVPVELEPLEGVDDLRDVLRRGALAIRVLDPKDEGSTRLSGQ